ncbi:MAG: MipA/OmpV family protein [Pseudomonadota bacterium]
MPLHAPRAGRACRRVLIGALFYAAMNGALAVKANVFEQTLDLIANGLDFLLPDEFAFKEVRAQVGLGLGLAPDYLGSDTYEPRLVPLLDITYKDQVRILGPEAFVTFISTSNVRAGALVRYRFRRQESQNPALAGLGDVDGGFEVGGFAEGRIKSLLLRARLAQDISGGHKGMSLGLSADHGIFLSPSERWGLAAGLKANWASGDYMNAFFGIDGEQSLRSGLTPYSASAGFRDVAGRVVGRYSLNDHWRLYSLIQVGRLLGEAKASPLVKERGSATQVIIGAGLLYRF